MWRLVYDPITGNFELRKIQVIQGDTGGGTITAGSLLFPSGATFEVVGNFAANGNGEFLLEPGSEIRILS